MFATDMTPAESEPRLLRAGTLTAAYSIGRSYVTGDWIAVGSVRSDGFSEHLPVWILVGYGTSARDALDDLHRHLALESIKFSTWSQKTALV